MKIIAITEGTRVSPASRIRIYELLDRLQNERRLSYSAINYTSAGYCRKLVAGVKIGIARSILEQGWHLLALLWLVKTAIRADMVLIQRVLLPLWLQKLLKKINHRIIYDYDDAVYLHDKARERRFAHQVVSAAVVIAVSEEAARQALLRGADREKTTVIYTPVDCARFELIPERNTATFTVGWVGSPATSNYLENIWPELAEFAGCNENLRFVFIGCPPFDTGDLASSVRFVSWSSEVEQKELPQLDVGLMPLRDSGWERGKGGYKLIQYMAAGVATLASPVGANLEIVEEGRTGLFADGPGQWSEKLGELIADRDHCREMGLAGRARAEKLYDYKVAADKFANIIADPGDSAGGTITSV